MSFKNNFVPPKATGLASECEQITQSGMTENINQNLNGTSDTQGDRRTMLLFALGGNSDFGGESPNLVVQRAISALRCSEIGGSWWSSCLYRTPAFPAGSGADFANAVVICEAPEVSAEVALAIAHGIEAEFGRTRAERWGARTLDIDLIAAGPAGGQVAPDLGVAQQWRDLPMDAQLITTPQTLILPHPRVTDRSFVLVPLVEVAPDWIDPLSGQSACALLAARPAQERASVVPW